MLNAITSTYEYIRQTIAIRGDMVLSSKEDPFIYDEHLGAYIEAGSVHPHFLTWAYLEGAVVAIHNALYLQGKYKTSAFSIWDEQVGMVGAGSLRKGEKAHGNSLTNIARNMSNDHKTEGSWES